MQNGDKGLQSINLTSQGILVKMLIITFEPHGIFLSNFCIHFNIIKTHVYKIVTRLHQGFFHKSQETSDLAPSHMLFNASELAPLLQRYMPFCCVVVPV